MNVSKCCGERKSCCSEEHCEFLDWWWKKDRTYTKEEVAALLEEVKKFNCGAIDQYLDRHVNKVFQEWAKRLEG